VLALEVVDAAPPDDITGDALRRNLPKQSTRCLYWLTWLGCCAVARRSIYAKPVAEAVARLWQALPSADSLSEPVAWSKR